MQRLYPVKKEMLENKVTDLDKHFKRTSQDVWDPVSLRSISLFKRIETYFPKFPPFQLVNTGEDYRVNVGYGNFLVVKGFDTKNENFYRQSIYVRGGKKYEKKFKATPGEIKVLTQLILIDLVHAKREAAKTLEVLNLVSSALADAPSKCNFDPTHFSSDLLQRINFIDKTNQFSISKDELLLLNAEDLSVVAKCLPKDAEQIFATPELYNKLLKDVTGDSHLAVIAKSNLFAAKLILKNDTFCQFLCSHIKEFRLEGIKAAHPGDDEIQALCDSLLGVSQTLAVSQKSLGR